jgi:hypothetical protein
MHKIFQDINSRNLKFKNKSAITNIHRFVDQQVLAFFTNIASCMSASEIQINLLSGLNKFDEQQLLSVNRLLKTFPIHGNLCINCAVVNIKCLQDVEDKMLPIYFLRIEEESDIPILMELLASPRPDGQQRVVCPYFPKEDLQQKLVAAIKKVHFGWA